MKKTEAIKAFLNVKALPDLASMYNANMECQLNVAQDKGEPTDGEFKGRKWRGWTDGFETWKPFRIPWNAGGEATYVDSDLQFTIDHTEAIGMTGWDWGNKCSRWVAFDFDAIVGHSESHTKKLTPEELKAIETSVTEVPWVTLRNSTGGTGLHVYVTLDPPVATNNHHEHAALARAILGLLSGLTGVNFVNKVDVCGGNMWVWHRKVVGNDKSLAIKKSGIPLDRVPPDWRNHVVVTSRTASRSRLNNDVDDLVGKLTTVVLDDGHKKLLHHLQNTGSYWSWDPDRALLVCHTYDLKIAHTVLGLSGIFDTLSKGSEQGSDHNCFASPGREGAWIVRRFTKGTAEAKTWYADSNGWTTCILNRRPDLKAACGAAGGIEDEKGNFVFDNCKEAAKALEYLGVTLQYAEDRFAVGRPTVIKPHSDFGKLIVQMDFINSDNRTGMENWLISKKKYFQTIVVYKAETNVSVNTNYDNLLRHVVTDNGQDDGWLINSDDVHFWRAEPMGHVFAILDSIGISGPSAKSIVGHAVNKYWRLTNMPFKPEYPGDRKWNKNAAQLRIIPSKNTDNLVYPTWQSVFSHAGEGLNDAVENHPWCQANGIRTGGDYLKCWAACLFQRPEAPLPYLFFYSPEQNTGKSTFHESLMLLFDRGVARADTALESQQGFNGELEGAVLCITEETDIKRSKNAYNRIKDWVTSKHISIHHKNQTPYLTINTTHWVQCSNDHNAVPILPGDTRIVVARVQPLNPVDLIPKDDLMTLLETEAADFLAELMNLELPKSNDRLALPVVTTSEKHEIQNQNMSHVEEFIRDNCVHAPGYVISLSEFWDKFVQASDENTIINYTKSKIGKELTSPYVKGRSTMLSNAVAVGNIAWRTEQNIEERPPLILDGSDTLRPRKVANAEAVS